jgi:trk/ktr system potassium uptake protein
MRFLNQLINRYNSFIYDQKKWIKPVLDWSVFIVAFASVALLIYYIGFPITDATALWLQYAMDVCLFLFVIEFMLKWAFEVKRLDFIRRNMIRAILLLFILTELLLKYLFDISLFHFLTRFIKLGHHDDYHFFNTLLLAVIAINRITVESWKIFSFSIRPERLFLLSFLSLIMIGTGLLMLPEMTVGTEAFHFIDALFTSTSATCVTGLIVVDTGTFFTIKGQIVILLLMQFGGIGILTFAGFFAIILRNKASLQQHKVIRDMLNTENFKSGLLILKKIISYTLFIELIGAVLIYLQMGNNSEYMHNGESLKPFYAIFHAVSAFCNAGFSLFSDSMMHIGYADHSMMLLTIAVLIILGGIGFPVLYNIFNLQQIRERRQKPWKKWNVNTVLAVYSSAVLILIGFVAFWFFEQKYSLTGLSTGKEMVHAFFQSVTTRTAGFNSIDIPSMSLPVTILFLFLMFVGGSSGSTAGGIKTSTFVILMKSVMSNLTNRNRLVIRKRTISHDLLHRAFSIFTFAIFFIFLGLFLLSYFEPDKSLLDLVFEEVSAFGTVGLSRGITSQLSAAGKAVIILSMYIGRVGSLTLIFSLSFNQKKKTMKYPSGYIMIG